MIQNTNGWNLLKEEQDGTMVYEALNNPISKNYKSWHENFWDELDNFYNFDKKVCIDIGASYGWMTIPFSANFEKVYSFEPYEPVYSCLNLNIKNLDISNVVTYNYGLGSNNTQAMITSRPITGTNSILSGDSDENSIPVEIRTLDSFNFSDVDFIKIDVEGYELHVVSGSLNTIERCKPKVIVIEIFCNRDEYSRNYRQTIFNYLRDLNYQLYDIRQHDCIFTLR